MIKIFFFLAAHIQKVIETQSNSDRSKFEKRPKYIRKMHDTFESDSKTIPFYTYHSFTSTRIASKRVSKRMTPRAGAMNKIA